MNYFTERFIHKQKEHFLDSLYRAEANIGTHANPSWEIGEITRAEIDQDGMVNVQLIFMGLVDLPADVCQIRLIDRDGEIASLVDKKISTARGQGVYEKLKIDLFQNEAEVI